MTTSTSEFGKWRAKLWPVHTFELKKVVPMVLMFFLILFNYTILRDTKDTLVVKTGKSNIFNLYLSVYYKYFINTIISWDFDSARDVDDILVS